MIKKSIFTTLILTVLASLIACQSINRYVTCDVKIFCTEEVEGIKIAGVDGALLYRLNVSENKKLVSLINGVLAKDKTALKSLIDFDCGGGAGCYDLGFIFSQLAFKMGENEFIPLINDLSSDEKSGLESFLRVGLEYGYGDRVIGLDLKTTFPNLYLALQKNNE